MGLEIISYRTPNCRIWFYLKLNDLLPYDIQRENKTMTMALAGYAKLTFANVCFA